MSLGSVYTIISNSGQQDALLSATSYLKKRINEYILQKTSEYTEQDLLTLPPGGYLNLDNSTLPGLNMVEKSHNTFINGTYKPHVPVAFEYIKVPFNSPNFGQKISYVLPQVGNYINDMVLHIKIKGLSAKDPRDRVRYVSMLGHRLIESAQFLIDNGSILDEYTTDDYNAFYQMEVKEDKKIGWLRGIGQEIPHLGHITADPTFDMHQEYRWIGDGNQTLKQKHDSVELFIPLLFWFKDVKNALPSHIIPWGRTHVQIKLAEVRDIVGFADYGGGGAYNEPTIEFCNLHINNIFTLPEIYELYQKKYVFSLIRVHRHHKEKVEKSEAGILLNNLKWPIEYLYFSFRPRANLALSQFWHKNSKLIAKSYRVPVVAKNNNTVITGTVSSSSDSNKAVLVSAGLSSVDNTYVDYDFIITGGTGYNSADIVQNRYIVSTYNGTTKEITIKTEWSGQAPGSDTTFEIFTPQIAINSVNYYEESPVVNEISVVIDDIEVYRNNSELFYNSYLPGRYGPALKTPEDRGQYFLTHCLYPGHHQPSGSINASLCRELYLYFKSDTISTTYPVDLIVLARAINFLFIDQGVPILKYST